MKAILLALLAVGSLAAPARHAAQRGGGLSDHQIDSAPGSRASVPASETGLRLSVSQTNVSTGFSFNDAEHRARMVYYAAAAYSDNPQQCINSRIDQGFKVAYKKLTTYLGSKVMFYGGYSPSNKLNVISFRGTGTTWQLVLEILATLTLPSVPVTPGGNAQIYWARLYEVFRSEVVAAATALRRDFPAHRTVVVGHSLGGALASLAAAHLRSSGFPVVEFTYGMPRVGDYHYAKAHDSVLPPGTAYRVTHFRDIVSFMPLCKRVLTMCVGHRLDGRNPYHHGTEIHYERDMPPRPRTCTCIPNNECNKCNGGSILPSIKDHLTFFGVPVGSVCDAKLLRERWMWTEETGGWEMTPAFHAEMNTLDAKIKIWIDGQLGFNSSGVNASHTNNAAAQLFR